MKKYLLLIALAAAVAVGCKDESIHYNNGEDNDEEVGYLSMSGLNVDVADMAEEISSSAGPAAAGTRAQASVTEATDDYKVRIRSERNGSETVYTYAELKLPENANLPLAPGIYTVSAESPDYADYMATGPAATWEKPVYAGSVSKSVVSNEYTSVTDLVCTLANIKATVALSPDLMELFMSDDEAESTGGEKLSVTVTVGDGSIAFDRTTADGSRAAHFKASDEPSVMTVVLSGKYNKADADQEPEYVSVNWKQEISGCRAGQWRKISIGVADADSGNVQFEVTVENWVYDEKVEVDVSKLYIFGEETIPDEGVSDEGSPVVALEGGDIEAGYTIESSMYDEILDRWNDNMRVTFTPGDGASLASLVAEVSSADGELEQALEDAGFAQGKVTLWPENGAEQYVGMRESGSVVTAAVKDAGMTALFGFKGTHEVTLVATDDRGRTSYATIAIYVAESGSQAGPSIVWTDKAGTTVYDFDRRYNHDEVEIVVNVATESAFTAFTVDIISENVLPPAELAGVGLTDHLDLINPGEYESALQGLGFSTGEEVTGSKSVTFDISSFMGLLSLLNKEGDCDFRLTVTDGEGTVTKTIQLRVVI